MPLNGNGQLLNADGSVQVRISSGGNSVDVTTYANGDSLSANYNLLGAAGFGLGYNGTTWDRLRVDSQKNLKVGLYSQTGAAPSFTGGPMGDALSNTAQGFVGVGYGYGFNGLDWDRVRNNTQGTLLASAARTATAASATTTNYNASGIIIYLNVTLASGTGGLQLVVRSICPISGVTLNHNTQPTSITSTGMFGYEISNGASGSVTGTNAMQQRTAGALPRNFNVAVFHGDASGYTYSVGYALIL